MVPWLGDTRLRAQIGVLKDGDADRVARAEKLAVFGETPRREWQQCDAAQESKSAPHCVRSQDRFALQVASSLHPSQTRAPDRSAGDEPTVPSLGMGIDARPAGLVRSD